MTLSLQGSHQLALPVPALPASTPLGSLLLSPKPHPDLQLHPINDVPWVQHIPQGLAHLPALPVPNHGVKQHLGAQKGSAERGPGTPSLEGPLASSRF